MLGVENPANGLSPVNPPGAVLVLVPFDPNRDPGCAVLAPPPNSDCCAGAEVVVVPPPKRLGPEVVDALFEPPKLRLPVVDAFAMFDPKTLLDVLLVLLAGRKRPGLLLLVADAPGEDGGLDLN